MVFKPLTKGRHGDPRVRGVHAPGGQSACPRVFKRVGGMGTWLALVVALHSIPAQCLSIQTQDSK